MVTAESDTILRWELQRIGPCDWVIHDLRHPPPDARDLLASVSDDGDEVVVTWHRDVPLATRYVTAEAARDDVVRWMSRQPGGTRPIPIAHFPPTAR
ncbi:hypothetical protein [Microbacterium pumilum]|uniref:DUF2249 domain-containing protein n=1 Tax=Microbacterium pumilum TaxID=344165 RepID=A0ABP5D6I5_9MICO